MSAAHNRDLDLTSACDLAHEINDHPQFTLLAIGHFSPGDVAGMPWGVSLSRTGDGSRIVIWNRSEWENERAALDSPVFSAPVDDAPAVPRRRLDQKDCDQLTLF